jgi:hypothetical protein
MSELSKRVLFTVIMAPVSATIGFFVQKTLSSWGVLDPLAKAFGQWLKMNFATQIDTAAVLWGISAALSLTLYGMCLIFIWKILRISPDHHLSIHPTAAIPSTSLTPQPNMTIKEAAEWVAESSGGIWNPASDQVWSELRQAARDGRITVWGRPESAHLERPYKPREEISPDHWRHYAFDFLRCMHSEDKATCRSEPDDPRRYPLSKGYADLRVNTAQIKTLWTASSEQAWPNSASFSPY